METFEKRNTTEANGLLLFDGLLEEDGYLQKGRIEILSVINSTIDHLHILTKQLTVPHELQQYSYNISGNVDFGKFAQYFFQLAKSYYSLKWGESENCFDQNSYDSIIQVANDLNRLHGIDCADVIPDDDFGCYEAIRQALFKLCAGYFASCNEAKDYCSANEVAEDLIEVLKYLRSCLFRKLFDWNKVEKLLQSAVATAE